MQSKKKEEIIIIFIENQLHTPSAFILSSELKTFNADDLCIILTVLMY
jgi:hypothetical protein